MELNAKSVVKNLTHKSRTRITNQGASTWYKKGSQVHFSSLLFKVMFFVLACVYGLVMFEFIDPSYFQIEFKASPDVLIMTVIASLFVYFYMRKPKR